MKWSSAALTRPYRLLASLPHRSRLRSLGVCNSVTSKLRDCSTGIAKPASPPNKGLISSISQDLQLQSIERPSTNTDDFDMSQHLKNTSAIYRDLQEVLGLAESSGQPDLHDAVLICVDFEAFEHNQSLITEIGVALLDTAEIRHPIQETQEQDASNANASKSHNGGRLAALIDKVKYAHFRPIEFRNLVNRRFLQGCEEGFLFGTTAWISQKDVYKVVANIFQDPARIAEAADLKVDATTDQARNIFIVGHGLSNDTKYMKAFGLDPNSIAKIVRRVDTQVLAGSTKKAQVGLKRLLSGLGTPGQNWHNAGNDAAFTLQALLTMAVREAESPCSVVAAIQAAKVVPIVELPRSHKQAQHVFKGTSMLVADHEILTRRSGSPFRRKPNKISSLPDGQLRSKGTKRSLEETDPEPVDVERMKKPSHGSMSESG